MASTCARWGERTGARIELGMGWRLGPVVGSVGSGWGEFCAVGGDEGRGYFFSSKFFFFLITTSTEMLRIPWWSSGSDSMLSLPGPWVQSLVREVTSHKPHSVAKKKKMGQRCEGKNVSFSLVLNFRERESTVCGISF